MEKKIKLTKRQKEVVGRMRDGVALIRSKWFPYRCYMVIEKQPCYISRPTIDALYNQEIISLTSDSEYTLTDLGKTIEL